MVLEYSKTVPPALPVRMPLKWKKLKGKGIKKKVWRERYRPGRLMQWTLPLPAKSRASGYDNPNNSSLLDRTSLSTDSASSLHLLFVPLLLRQPPPQRIRPPATPP